MTLQDSPRYLSGEYDYEVVGGDTIYYHNYPDVSSTNNLGSVASGEFLARAVPSWVVSAGTSYIAQRERAGTTDPSLVEPADGAGSFYNAATRTFEMVTPTEADSDIWTLDRYGPFVEGADHTPLIQAFCDEVAELALDNKGATLLFPTGVQINSTGVTFCERAYFDLNGSLLVSTADPDTAALFTADPEKSADFILRNGRIQTDNTIVDIQKDPEANTGCGARIADLRIFTAGTPYQADYFVFTSVDFVTLDRIRGYNANRFFVFDSDYQGGETLNTQLYAMNCAVLNSSLAMYMRGVDLATISVDVNGCSTGFHVDRDCHRINFAHSHVEKPGRTTDLPIPEYTPHPGYGFWFEGGGRGQGISLNNISIYDPREDAVCGIYTEAPSSGTERPIRITDTYIEHDVGDYTSGTWQRHYLTGSIIWDAEWHLFTDDVHVSDSSSGNYTDIEVRAQGLVAPTSRNLLPFSRISRPEDLPTSNGSGTFAVSTSAIGTGTLPHARLLTFDTAEIHRYTTLSLKVGWHTLIFEGVTDTLGFYVYVRQNASPYTRMMTANFMTGDAGGTLMRVPFYVDEDGVYRVGLETYSTTEVTAEIGQIELHRGHVNAFTNDPTVSKASAAPTTGVYDVGDTVWNTAPSGAVPGWVCTTAPNTFQPLSSGVSAGTVASAAGETTLTGEPLITVSGTAAITSLTAGSAGRVVTLLASGAWTLTDGSNLKLAGDFTPAAGDTITLVSDGTNWIEIARADTT